jgi:hypothetical protein
MRRRCGDAANCLAGIAPISVPSKMIEPLLGSISRVIIIEVVDLPQPDSPTSPSVSPLATLKLMPSTARKADFGASALPISFARNDPVSGRGYSFTRFSTRISGSDDATATDGAFASAGGAFGASGSRSASDMPMRGVACISLRV